MRQLLISILSSLVGSENKIEVKKPNIHFKEGFRRLVAACCIIGFLCGVFAGEFVTALSCSALCYIGYFIIEVLFCWIGAGFSGKKRKRTLLKEWQIKYKYWNRKCQREHKQCEAFNENIVKNECQIEYNRNPFIPKGRMRRFDYIVYSTLLNVIMKVIEYDLKLHTEKISICAVVSFWFFAIIQMFIVKNRIYDITLSNKKAWILSGLWELAGFVLSSINVTLVYWMLPIGLVLMVMPSKLTKDNKKTQEKSSFDIMKEMRNLDSESSPE